MASLVAVPVASLCGLFPQLCPWALSRLLPRVPSWTPYGIALWSLSTQACFFQGRRCLSSQSSGPRLTHCHFCHVPADFGGRKTSSISLWERGAFAAFFEGHRLH